MGRGPECEIKIDNASISRNHARIERKKDCFYVFDNKSKYGTLLKYPKIYIPLDLTKKGIQIDRTMMMLSLVKNNLLN